MRIYVDMDIVRDDERVPVSLAFWRDGDEMRRQACFDARYGSPISLTVEEELRAVAEAWRQTHSKETA